MKIIGSISKNNVQITEYEDSRIFIQCGVMGFFLNGQEAKDVYDLLNYYHNLDNFSMCTLKVEGNHVAL
jgi:hypothetical protein